MLTRFEGDKLILAAADGFRLAVREETIGDRVSSRFDILVPARAYRELARIIGDSTEPLKLSITPNQTQLLVKIGETSFLSRLIEGTFPDFRQIVPREVATRVESAATSS